MSLTILAEQHNLITLHGVLPGAMDHCVRAQELDIIVGTDGHAALLFFEFGNGAWRVQVRAVAGNVTPWAVNVAPFAKDGLRVSVQCPDGTPWKLRHVRKSARHVQDPTA